MQSSNNKTKAALVTGGARGIGKAIAIALSNAGYCVAINYLNSSEAAEELARSLPNSIAVRGDVSNQSEVADMVKEAEKSFGKIDLLVNNAGIAWQGLITDMTADEFDRIYEVNLKGVFLPSRAVLPGMIQRKSGRIVCISSIWGITGASCEVAYSAMKAGVIGFTKALAKEVAPSGITVNCVAPGVTATDMCASLSQDTLDILKEETPLGMIGTPEDTAAAVVYLASEQASFVTGQVISPNGGMVI